MNKCSKCDKNTNSDFKKDGKILCGVCARNHALIKIAEIELEISYLKREMEELNKESLIAYQQDCEHELEYAGFTKIIKRKLKFVYKCKKCDEIILKDKWE